jgi:hypothetical protein
MKHLIVMKLKKYIRMNQSFIDIFHLRMKEG